jgi:hypothetical protein
MKRHILHGSELMSVIKDKIQGALESHDVRTIELVEFYLVNLLQDFHSVEGAYTCHGENAVEKPLAVLLLEALEGDITKQIRCLKRVGDTALIVAGFFSDSLHRGIMRPSYYVAIGRSAYASLALIHEGHGSFFEIYDELSAKFPKFVRVIAAVAPWNAAASDSDILRIYERWIMTGDKALKHVLEQNGILAENLGD